MKTRIPSQGSVLLMAICTIAVLGIVAAAVLTSVGARYHSTYQSASWHEALYAAESGVDKAVATLNYSLAAPDTAWASWTPSDATTFPKTYSAVVLTHGGDGNQKMYVSTTIDNSIRDASAQVWYRVRCTGTTEIPGPGRVGIETSIVNASGQENHLNQLRRMSFKTDRTGGNLHVPQVSRTIEVMVRNLAATPFLHAAAVARELNMTGGAYTDSFDSRSDLYPEKSNNGQYDPAKRQSNGNVATNSNGSLSDLKNSYVYGDASSNGGTLKGTANVQGTVHNNYSASFPAVDPPVFTSIDPTYTTVNKPNLPVRLPAGTAASPANYKLETIYINKDTAPLILTNPIDPDTGNPRPNEESYINIWVTGDMVTTATGLIQQMPGVHATIYVEGDVKLTGSSIQNQNGKAPYLTLYGVTPSDGSMRDWDISGSANFIGAVYAPAFDFKLTGGGDLMGSFVFRSAAISGSAGFHYDEALAASAAGARASFVVSSWIEDLR